MLGQKGSEIGPWRLLPSLSEGRLGQAYRELGPIPYSAGVMPRRGSAKQAGQKRRVARQYQAGPADVVHQEPTRRQRMCKWEVDESILVD